MKEIKIGVNLYKINYSQETADAVLNKIIEWVEQNGAISEEIIMQSDECIISAPEILSDIVDDILKPEKI